MPRANTTICERKFVETTGIGFRDLDELIVIVLHQMTKHKCNKYILTDNINYITISLEINNNGHLIEINNSVVGMMIDVKDVGILKNYILMRLMQSTSHKFKVVINKPI